MKVIKICLLSILFLVIKGDVSAQQYTDSVNYQKDKENKLDLSDSESNVIMYNPDDPNDKFKIKGLHFFTKVDLKIYNRWGNIVYENSNYKDDWDGKAANGDDLKEGVYYYYVKDDGIRGDLKGTINIFR